jgi:hypothetical protein
MTNTWNGSPQRELTQNPLSGKLGADQIKISPAEHIQPAPHLIPVWPGENHPEIGRRRQYRTIPPRISGPLRR